MIGLHQRRNGKLMEGTALCSKHDAPAVRRKLAATFGRSGKNYYAYWHEVAGNRDVWCVLCGVKKHGVFPGIVHMETAENHSFCSDLLSPGGDVLDVGCRGFGFSRAMAERGMKVLALDPDTAIRDPKIPGVTFVCKALVDDPALHSATYASWSTGEGNYVVYSGEVPAHAEASKVECVHILELMKEFDVDRFDLVKFDCESSEYGILLHWPGPIARQIAVEFHDFLGMNPFENEREPYYQRLFAHIGQWYDVVQHERFIHPAMVKGPMNYWDSLFVLKSSEQGKL